MCAPLEPLSGVFTNQKNFTAHIYCNLFAINTQLCAKVYCLIAAYLIIIKVCETCSDSGTPNTYSWAINKGTQITVFLSPTSYENILKVFFYTINLSKFLE